MTSRANRRRLAVFVVLGLLATACSDSRDDTEDARPLPADECESAARDVVDDLEAFVGRFPGLSPEEFVAIESPEGLDEFQSEARSRILDGVVAGCVEDAFVVALDVELERLGEQGELASFLGESIRSGGLEPAREVTVEPGEDLVALLSSLGSGSVVTLEEGEYDVSVPLRVDVDLTIVGAGKQTVVRSSAPEAAIAVLESGSLILRELTVEHDGSAPASVVLTFRGPIALDGVRLSGARADEEGGGGSGLVVAPSLAELDGVLADGADLDMVSVVVTDSELVDNDVAGMVVSADLEPVVTGSLLAGNGACGICFFENARGEVTDSTFEGNLFGVQVSDAARPVIDGNRFVDNTGTGMVVDGSAAPIANGNTFEENGTTGIQVFGSAAPRLTDNTLGVHPVAVALGEDSAAIALRNTIEGAEVGFQIGDRAAPRLEENTIRGAELAGFAFDGEATGSVTDNEIVGGFGTGVLIGGEAAPTLVGNTIADGVAGVVVVGSATPHLTGNVITASGTVGVQILESAAPTIEGNVVDGPGVDGVGFLYGDQSGGTATGNLVSHYSLGFQVGDSAAPDLLGNTVGNVDAAAFLLGGLAMGSLEGNVCPGEVPGIVVAEDAAPEVGDNDCSVVDG